MKTESRHTIIDREFFKHRVPPGAIGIDVIRAPGLVWLRGETDESETASDFVARACREARDAGFAHIEFSGRINTDGA
jgi:hypothetical protein